MKRVIILFVLLGLYTAINFPLTRYMRSKPFEEKLGYVPTPRVLKLATGDQKILFADWLVLKTLVYFGGQVEIEQQRVVKSSPPDYYTMCRNMETAVRLDPYNMDAYYFAQSFMVWEVGRVNDANKLLEYGMKYRTWDYYLPFFAGFNYAYFFKDYGKAAENYKRAAELSGDPLFANLAGRYFYESGQTGMAIDFLSSMERGARNESVRKTLRLRMEALEKVREIEKALALFRARSGSSKVDVQQLVSKGCLKQIPKDPYGGVFYIDEQGQVRTTSKLSPPTEPKPQLR